MVETNDLAYYIGGAAAALIAGWLGYMRRPPVQAHGSGVANSTLTALGMELGTREQMERLIQVNGRCADALERIGDALADRNADAMQDKLDALMRKMEGMEQRRPPTR